MRRKEIFFKKLSFILGIILIVSFVKGTEVPLPIRSEIKLSQIWGDFQESKRVIIIKQDGDEINIVVLKDEKEPMGIGEKLEQGFKAGIISKSEFKILWDSLNSLNLWSLKEEYRGQGLNFRLRGNLYVAFEKEESVKISKTIFFTSPNSFPSEFETVYELVQRTGNLAQNSPSLNMILKYGNFRYGEESYGGIANQEIGRISDPKYLDTLILLLPREKNYTEAIITALRNIGAKTTIPALIKVLKTEAKKKELDDETISSTIQAISELTGQNFSYNSSDSLKAKKEVINKWINWWKENKEKFK
jgi:hypothetical protein